ncbi:MAG: DUF4405 domain-containing protein [Selenomonadales bacterium]|nr:DUF4405 domain-containing protein [Selenomonadales bacterium]
MKRMKWQIGIDILLLISMLAVLVTGYILDFHLVERPGRGIVKRIHIYGGYATTVLVILHVIEYTKILLNKMRIMNR